MTGLPPGFPDQQQQQQQTQPHQVPSGYGPLPGSGPNYGTSSVAATGFNPPAGSIVSPKEPDAIKLFVGMLPKHLDVADLRPVFEPYGEIHDLAVLKDRATGISKGLLVSSSI